MEKSINEISSTKEALNLAKQVGEWHLTHRETPWLMHECYRGELDDKLFQITQWQNLFFISKYTIGIYVENTPSQVYSGKDVKEFYREISKKDQESKKSLLESLKEEFGFWFSYN